jgi:two-component system, NarL family, response regulator NreC
MGMRVVIADDHAIVRHGLKHVLEQEGCSVVGEARDGQEAVELAARLNPDLVILDTPMPALSGLDAAREILRAVSPARVLILTAHSTDRNALEALRIGVSGYVLKSAGLEALVEGIREIGAGRPYLSDGISRAVRDTAMGASEAIPDPLSPRERQVLKLIAEGNGTKQVAVVLGVSVKTAESHRGHIMDKLGIRETAGLVRYAIRQGLIEP